MVPTMSNARKPQTDTVCWQKLRLVPWNEHEKRNKSVKDDRKLTLSEKAATSQLATLG